MSSVAALQLLPAEDDNRAPGLECPYGSSETSLGCSTSCTQSSLLPPFHK